MPYHLKNNALAALVPVVLIMMNFAGKAAAETATNDVQVYAGLAPALQMECTDVNFGVWRVPTVDRSGATTVTLDASSVATATVTGGNTADTAVSLSTKYDNPAAGTCDVTGSTATSGDGEASFSTGGSDRFIGILNNPFAPGLGLPGSIPPFTDFNFTLDFSTDTPAIDVNGAATFQVIGEMEIPNNLIPQNYGSYKSHQLITVLFDDAPAG